MTAVKWEHKQKKKKKRATFCERQDDVYAKEIILSGKKSEWKIVDWYYCYFIQIYSSPHTQQDHINFVFT